MRLLKFWIWSQIFLAMLYSGDTSLSLLVFPHAGSASLYLLSSVLSTLHEFTIQAMPTRISNLVLRTYIQLVEEAYWSWYATEFATNSAQAPASPPSFPTIPLRNQPLLRTRLLLTTLRRPAQQRVAMLQQLERRRW